MTSMIDIDEFLPAVLRYAPNTSDLVAQRHIISAAQKICTATKMWKENDTFTISTPEQDCISTIPDASIIQIQAARLDDRELTPKPVLWLDDNHSGWALDTATGVAKYITQLEPNTVSIYPRQTGTLSARLILKPSRGALSLPEFLFDLYFDDIATGAASELLTDPQSSNPQLGLDFRQRFQKKLDDLSYECARGQQASRLRTKGAYF